MKRNIVTYEGIVKVYGNSILSSEEYAITIDNDDIISGEKSIFDNYEKKKIRITIEEIE